MIERRIFVKALALSPFVYQLSEQLFAANIPIMKKIPSLGISVPVIGVGTSRTFNVGASTPDRMQVAEVLREFFAAGGTLIDSSPMYGSSEEVIGFCLDQLGRPKQCFSATKVWSSSKEEGAVQIENSFKHYREKVVDMLVVHNLVGLPRQLEYLKELKKQGRIRAIGVSTSHGRRHRELEELLKKEDIDVVQLTYNIIDREAEKRLLPLAKEKGVAIVVNRPFQRGALIDKVKAAKKPLPPYAKELKIDNWACFLLKYIASHPAVTVAIPATTQVKHMQENMSALLGELPDAATRVQMEQTIASI